MADVVLSGMDLKGIANNYADEGKPKKPGAV